MSEEKYDSDYIRKIVGLLEEQEQKMKQHLAQCGIKYKMIRR